MNKNRITKSSLIVSCLSLVLCVSMLIGTTFAWFTSDVTNSGNTIEAGTLNVQLYEKMGTNYTDITNSETPIFDYDKWEPGYTAKKVLQLRTTGTLALRYQVVIKGLENLDPEVTKGIENVLDVSVNDEESGTLADFADGTTPVLVGCLIPGESLTTADLNIKIHMQEDAGNTYQGVTLPAFNVVINAAQYTSEADDVVGDQYDLSAIPAFGE